MNHLVCHELWALQWIFHRRCSTYSSDWHGRGQKPARLDVRHIMWSIWSVVRQGLKSHQFKWSEVCCWCGPGADCIPPSVAAWSTVYSQHPSSVPWCGSTTSKNILYLPNTIQTGVTLYSDFWCLQRGQDWDLETCWSFISIHSSEAIELRSGGQNRKGLIYSG
jgi:hypothetical protein